ncbi:ISL3 family transposase IS652 [bioreactor metagenome]|uniref:ISL3 family transposase IS652 n=1 Tax=bioreactor metagenome TaxID=1076179 RepID=A0A645CUH9_9ZZZZ
MLQTHLIAELLGMEAFDFESVEQDEKKILLNVRMKRRTQECPACQTPCDQVHDYRLQRVKDSPIQGKAVIWQYRKRRYRCPCCGKRFYEGNYLLPKRHRITNRLAALGIDQLRKKQSRKEIAVTLGVSESSIVRWMNLLEFGKPTLLPKVLSIDEFRGNTEYGKLQCILTDPVHKRIVDVLPTRYHSQIYDYLRSFSNRNQVEYFVMDMNREYMDIAKKLLPNAKIVIDRFHVVRYCTWALENVRKRVQMKLLPEQRKYFKRSRKLLLAHMRDLSAENKAAVERMLLLSCDLREAYLLKEKFYDFMASTGSSQAKERLRAFRAHAFVADLPEFSACLTMLRNWEPYILNAFDCPYSNGFTEGVNNKIKVLKRIAFGYRSFRNFRIRILCTTNV